ncbi:MAG: ParB/RepB/Spo0J family partition protein [Elusimicrobia bacterium]|nr:ParB/RepB/Spo0J family partition protein [Elusimicrobiota bacterium]
MAKGLGRGLEALIPGGILGKQPDIRGEEILKLTLDKIKPNKYQARKKFDIEKLTELAQSIKEKGVIQPLIVSPSLIPGEFELIAGERRYRACKMTGLKEIPAIVRHVNDKERSQISLIENIQREDLDPIEEANGFKSIIEEFKLTQEELAKLVGKERSVVANTLRLLNLPEEIQELVSSGSITSGHARTLAGIPESDKQKELLKRIQREKLTVREIENIVKDWKSEIRRSGGKPVKRKRSAELIDFENNLQKALGTKVQVFSRGKKGKIIIHFYSLEELDKIVRELKKSRNP